MTERLWFKIGETAERIGATPKELRYWEKLLPEIQPRRSRGNLRYYHIDEIPRLKAIRQWLDEGFTVLDCRALLQGEAPRIPVLPEGLACQIDLSAWQLPPVFRWLAETAGMSEPELLKTFNCGIGMIAVVAADRADAIEALFRAEGETVTRLGRVVPGEGVIYKGRLL